MAGLGSFVSGFTSGVDVKNRWDDRKRRQKHEDEDREWQDETRDWSREDRDWAKELRGWDREDRDYTKSERERKRAEEDRRLAAAAADRQAHADAYAAAEADASAAPSAARRSIEDPLSVGGARPELTFGLPPVEDPIPRPQVAVDPNTPRDAPAGPDMVVPGREQPVTAPRRALPGEVGDPRRSYLTVPRADDEPPAEYRDVTFEEWQGMSRSERRALGLKVSDIGGQMQFKRFSKGWGAEPHTVRVKVPPEERVSGPEDLPADPYAPQPHGNPPRRAVDGADGPGVVGAPEDGKPIGGVPEAGPAFRGIADTEEEGAKDNDIAQTLGADPDADPAPGMPAAAAPSVKLAEDAAATVVKPSRRSVDGRPKLTFGEGIKPTPAERRRADRATSSFMDRYIEKSVPMLVKHYLQTGQVDKAKAFDEWANDRETKESIRHWSKGVFAASIGDESGMLNSFMTYYNGINDGVTVVKDESGFTKDSKGQNNGIELTFRDDDTGETWVQRVEGTEGLLQQGIYGLAPERMFEVLYGQMEKAQAVEAAGVEADQKMVLEVMKIMGRDGGKDDPVAKRVTEIADEMVKNIPGFSNLPQEQKIAAILQQMEVENTATGAARRGLYSNDVPLMMPSG